MRLFALAASIAFVLQGCTVATGPAEAPATASRPVPAADAADISRFRTIAARVEPVAERICREHANSPNCDFNIVIDDRPGLAPNAYQTLDKNNRPILAFTLSILADVVRVHRRQLVSSSPTRSSPSPLLPAWTSIAPSGSSACDRRDADQK